mmetsp:Transcript_1627/g.1128  ORF Transcript_1627/g.1128 Transcript_1627/m.1128 type:complete len:196 (-) Transcript_1627:29-616(-)
MIDPKTIAFDIDGVFADTVTLFLNIAKKDYRIEDIKYEDITSYMLEQCIDIDPIITRAIIDKILTGDYNFTLNPIDRAIDVLTKLGKSMGHLLFVTARPHLGHMKDWVLNCLSKLAPNTIELIATGSFEAKTDILLSKNKTYFLEDRLETCFDLNKAGITPILYKQPWNREPHPFIEVNNWSELESLIDFESLKV